MVLSPVCSLVVDKLCGPGDVLLQHSRAVEGPAAGTDHCINRTRGMFSSLHKSQASARTVWITGLWFPGDVSVAGAAAPLAVFLCRRFKEQLYITPVQPGGFY